MQGVVYECKSCFAGGGSRFLALLFAIISILTITMLPTVEPASAANGEKLYCIPKGTSKILEYQGKGSPVKIGYTNTGYGTTGPTADFGDRTERINPTDCTGDTGSVTPAVLEDHTNVDNTKSFGYGGIGYSPNDDGAPTIDLDNDGRLHFLQILYAGSTSSMNYLVDARGAETYRFSAIAYFFDPASRGTQGTILIGHRVAETGQPSTVAQMPTTGAPEGLSTIGLLAIGVGLVGVTLALARRRA